MFSSLTTKIALKRAGLLTDLLNFSGPVTTSTSPIKLRKNQPEPGLEDEGNGSWGSWMSVKSLPLTAQAWLSPPPPPVAIGRVPGIGDKAPTDKNRKIVYGGGRRVLLVFLRCVGCAFAQKTFLNLRTLANRYGEAINCIAVSHSSEQATKKWIDLLGGAWNVQIVIDEEREIYAAWGLGIGNTWYVLNPATQIQSWKEKGWLGEKVAGSIQKNGVEPNKATSGDEEEDGVSTVMGNKWQEAGAFSVDGTGTVIWGGKALRADDVMDLDMCAKILVA
ncbi:Fc.00g057390.m01.CDS01 [Cosmosporella sp. VM-42]